MNESGRLISADFLLRLANDDLTSEEILKLYFKYYFCQGKNIRDLRLDYMRLRSRGCSSDDLRYLNFNLLSKEKIEKAIDSVKDAVNEFMIRTFGLELNENTWR